MLLRSVHFDILKFECEEYSRKNRIQIIKNQPIFELFKKYIEKTVVIEMQYGMTFEDVQISEAKKLSAKVLV